MLSSFTNIYDFLLQNTKYYISQYLSLNIRRDGEWGKMCRHVIYQTVHIIYAKIVHVRDSR